MSSKAAATYANPILNADWPDPDVIEVDGVYYLVASSFNRAPGLPLLRSSNLVDWAPAGHALPRLVPEERFSSVQRGGGVWAPAIRHHAGRFWIFYPDPDQGIFVTHADKIDGEWSSPHLLLPGLGVIDPCPLWDDDGAAYLVHGWAASRAGVKNRLSLRRMSPDARTLIDDGDVVVIEGNDLPGYTTLEGPKFYKHDGYYWIFAPAGGVATGWQSAFRSRTPYGPYEGRIVLDQGATAVNGPHQGAWVHTPGGQDWFLHFQDRGPYGRVVHLQPMTWTQDGWPVIGNHVPGESYGQPVHRHPYPLGTSSDASSPATSDDFARPGLGPQWHWQANPGQGWYTANGTGTLVLHAQPTTTGDLRRIPHVLGQVLPGTPTTVATTLDASEALPGTFSGLAILGLSYGWLGIERTATGFTLRGGTDDLDLTVRPLDGPILELSVSTTADHRARFKWRCTTTGAWHHADWEFDLSKGHWIGAEIAIFAATTRRDTGRSNVSVGPVRVTIQSAAEGRNEQLAGAGI